ncbi:MULTISPECIES: cation:proton antiporter [Halomicrobium]|uniref:Sodium/hydrogen exchanger n=2 Tax=Halomicrobium mukohataei TaxID=57705 RepID=C7P021_HALMD|nr:MULTISPECIES: cation:proton antiporter [Halomicrobium]ACV46929.1 sodium/hydrogen exchanger [Halomicrobium mukohataei DSM 12286]QCD65425.1 cation:proton antiporter [Halomicrobium mukohataei]QFR20231.1 cation:proton antiporter [Halomicrobium sp. ZPS1]
MAALLVELGVALVALALAGIAANRLSLSVIPAYILVGILVGPNPPTEVAGLSLQIVGYGEFVELAAELGIVVLLFFLGLEFSVGQLLDDRRRIASAGAVDFLLNFGIGVAIGLAFGRTLLETVLLAGIVYISSSAIVTKTLIEQGWIANPEADPVLGTLVFEDILIAVYLAVVAALVTGTGGLSGAVVDVGVAFAFLGGLALVAWYATRFVEATFDLPSDELFLLSVVGTATLIAGVALSIGVSEAVAAFFVGTAFSQTSHTERIEHVIAPTRDLFAAFFFFSIGLQTDVTLLAGVAGLLAVAVVATTVTKLTSGAISGRIYGLSPTRSLRTGLALISRGEFSLIIAALVVSAAGSGNDSLADFAPVVTAFAVGYVLVMSVLGTVLVQYADAITGRLVPLLDR